MTQDLIVLGILLAVCLHAYLIVAIQSKKERAPVNWKNFAQIVEKLAPVALSVIPGVPAPLVPVIVHGIQVAEQLGPKQGAAKKAQVVDLVNTVIAAANAAAEKQVIDPTSINAVSNGIDAAVGFSNVLHRLPVAPDADLPPVA